VSSRPKDIGVDDLDLLAGALGRLANGRQAPVRVVSATVLREGVHRIS
jgi:hypothetical protein